MFLILFVCTANQFRSPLAAACMESKLHEEGLDMSWTVASAGTWTANGLPAHPEALSAAAELGLDISEHRTQEVTEALLSTADLIIVMEPGHKEALDCEFPDCRQRIYLLGELAGESNPVIPDPSLSNFIDSEVIAKIISDDIDKGFSEILRRAEISRNIRLGEKSNPAE